MNTPYAAVRVNWCHLIHDGKDISFSHQHNVKCLDFRTEKFLEDKKSLPVPYCRVANRVLYISELHDTADSSQGGGGVSSWAE